MGRKLTRKGLVKKVDEVHSKIIRIREKFCVLCGSRENLQCGHIFSRVSYSTRWDLAKDGNAHGQCRNCNLNHEYHPYLFFKWYLNNFGKKRLEELHNRSRETKKYKNYELENLLRELKEKLKEITQEVLM